MLMNDYTAKLLNLEDVIITNIDNISDQLHVYIELPRRKHICPCCGAETDRVHDYRTQVIKDVPLARDTCMCQVDIGKIISGIQITNTASLDRKPSVQFACAATADGNINSLPQSSHGPLYCPLNFQSRPSHPRWWLLSHQIVTPASGNIILRYVLPCEKIVIYENGHASQGLHCRPF